MEFLIYLIGFLFAYILQYIDFVVLDKVTWTVGHRFNAIKCASLSWIIVLIGLIYMTCKWFGRMEKSDEPASW
jgi:hypothetical protein